MLVKYSTTAYSIVIFSIQYIITHNELYPWINAEQSTYIPDKTGNPNNSNRGEQILSDSH